MGQYRLGFYLKSGFGLYFHFEDDQINIWFLCVEITIGLKTDKKSERDI